MKTKLLVISPLFTAILLAGCDPSADTAVRSSSGASDETAARQEILESEAAEDDSEYTYSRKDEFVAAVEEQWEDLKRKLSELSESVAGAGASIQEEAKPKLEALRAQADSLGDHLESLKNATESTWDSVKAGTRDTLEDAKDGLQKARQWVSDKLSS